MLNRDSQLLRAARRWFSSHAKLKDRLRPILRRLGYAWPVHRELRKHLQDVRVYRAIQIGAHDGVTHDPCREYFTRSGWTAVVVEPNPSVFELLKENYRRYPNVHPVYAAVSYSTAEVTLWRFDDTFLARRADASTLSTLVSTSRDNVLRFLDPKDEAVNHLEPIQVKCVTVEQLAKAYKLPSVEGIFVDVEGAEEDILLHVDYNSLGVRLVLFENHLLADRGARINEHLKALGFRTIDAAADTVAVR